MGSPSAIIERLAWRAKWRRRWQKSKNLVILSAVLLFGVPSFLAFTPMGPQYVFDYIVRENPVDKPIQPWGTEWMFKLGYFYSVTMRESEAKKCYETMETWYWKNFKKMQLEKGEPWIGRAVFYHAEILNRTHKQKAFEMFGYYLDNFSSHPDSDPVLNQRATLLRRIYKVGA